MGMFELFHVELHCIFQNWIFSIECLNIYISIAKYWGIQYFTHICYFRLDRIRFSQELGFADDDKKVVKLKQKLEKLHAKVLKSKSGSEKTEADRNVLGAYVTFNDKRDLLRIMHAYRWSAFFLGVFLQKKDLQFEGGKLWVKVAAEPSNILW